MSKNAAKKTWEEPVDDSTEEAIAEEFRFSPHRLERIRTGVKKIGVHQAEDWRGQIQEVCARIVREFQPEKILLFGSHAYGAPRPGSDVDLLVVMPFEGDPLEKAVSILNRINLLVPIDLLVRTREQVEQRLEIGDRFMREVVERGKVLYDVNHT